jgi:hypothetical protein
MPIGHALRMVSRWGSPQSRALASINALPIEWATQLATSSQSLDNAQASPFWAVPADMQPWFLQAAGHEVDGEWGKMLQLTERWVAAEPANTEAKRALELARSKLSMNR